MHITLLSQCEKKAWPNSRRILDSYARRIGDRSWATPITFEGLTELHGMLKAAATRQTAVACYQSSGNQRMKLLWIVGSRSAFSTDGFAPVAYTRQKLSPPAPWFRDVCLLAQAAGYLHDWGKSSQDFADKLKRSVSTAAAGAPYVNTEAVRHEWLSYCLLKAAREKGFDDAWSGASSDNTVRDFRSLKDGVVNKDTALEFLIISHHKLLGETFQKGMINLAITANGHVKKPIPLGGVSAAVDIAGKPLKIDRNLFDDAIKLATRLGDKVGQDYWFLVSIVARACLILADHQISSINYADTHQGASTPELFANTKNIAPDGALRRYDQPLNWHLRNVGEKSAEIAQHLSRTRFDSLSSLTVETILEPSRNARFKWQDKAVDFLRKTRKSRSGPSLIFSGAGTGAGKTRANAKMVCALSDDPRFCVALNLRSLTLQTGDSLRNDLKIMPSEMAVVIGDRTVEKLHRASSDAFNINGDEDSEIEVIGPDYPMPAWLSVHANGSKSNQLLMPPVLVSTVDFIINASEPGRQGHHALAMLRVMNSDLVLDELDSYDPTAMIAVLRLIQMSAMFGRNVICSSATLSVPVASAAFQAFMSGVAMLKAADEAAGLPLVALIDDLVDPECIDADGGSEEAVSAFEKVLTARHGRLIWALGQKPVYRMPLIGGQHCKTERDYFQAVESYVQQMHSAHKWSIGLGRELSFGLIRVANIKTAISLARHLSQTLGTSGAKICCYHSNELRIQRHLKEKRLDFLLSRKDGKFKHIAGDPEVNAAFASGIPSVPFIVIATPVEEVGRDHDFDWAIIEPSSAQSIVQTCGRVNRHRLEPVESPNVVLMDRNMNAVRRPGKPCFVRPGLEGEHPRLRYSSDRVTVLAGTAPLDRIDASFRLGARPMGLEESVITKKRLDDGLGVILRSKGKASHWMSPGFYQKFPLREFSAKDQFRLSPCSFADAYDLEQLTNADQSAWEKRAYKSIPPAVGAWLSWSDEQLADEAERLGIPVHDGLFLELARYPGDEDSEIMRDHSFGFMRVKL